MAQDKVQLKREEVVGNDVVNQDIYPKTDTASITDSLKGVPLDQTLSLIKNMINNELSRVVNSVNGRSGIVVISAADVGLENVDNISFGDIKRWVIEYLGEIFGTKRIILREYLTEIHEIIGTNDRAYENTPFYAEKGDAVTADHMAYIGYIYWDESTNLLKEEHLQIRVVGFTDRSLIYNVNADSVGRDEFRNFAHGGLGVNIWSGEDALKIRNNIAKGTMSHSDHSAESLNDSGLYIDKSKVVPDVYFFDSVYGELYREDDELYNRNALVYWTSDTTDTTESTLPLIQIKVNGTEVSMNSSSPVPPTAFHTEQTFKVGDIILTNFSYEYCIDNVSVLTDGPVRRKMADSLTCRQPAIGRITQVGKLESDTPYIVEFYTCKPNVSHGLKLLETNGLCGPEDTVIGLDLLESFAKMNDETPIGAEKVNVSGINAFDQYTLPIRGRRNTNPKSLYTIYPTGKSNNILDETNDEIKNNSAFILPNYSLCVIPGYQFTFHPTAHPIDNWDSSCPIDDYLTLGQKDWNMLGINLEKVMWGESSPGGPTTYENARNVSGLRVCTDQTSLDDEWFGFGDGHTPISFPGRSGGLSVNVGDFLGIGTPEERDSTTPAIKSHFYDEGKVNVRIDKTKGLYNSGSNKLGINIAEGQIYQPEYGYNSTWLDGGLKFVQVPGEGKLAVNTGRAASGLAVKNNFVAETRYDAPNVKSEVLEDNVLTVNPYSFIRSYSGGYAAETNSMEIHRIVTEEDLAHRIPALNISSYLYEREATLSAEMNATPTPPWIDEDHIYVAGKRRFIYAQSETDKCVPYFVFYTTPTDYYNVINLLNGDSTDAGFVPPYPLPILKRQAHVLILDPNDHFDMYIVKVNMYMDPVDDARLPDMNHDGYVDSVDASTVMDLYGIALEMYSDPTHQHFYEDAALQTPIEPHAGWDYIDLNDNRESPDVPGQYFYMRYHGWTDPNTGIVGLKKFESGGRELTLDDYINADANRDGFIDAADATTISAFYSLMSTGGYPGIEGVTDNWIEFLKEELGIYVAPGHSGGAVEVLNRNYQKGLRFRYNELKGLTAAPDYTNANADVITVERATDIENALSIKIADQSAGMWMNDRAKYGGLRFCSEGYLGIRINENNSFCASLANANNIVRADDLSYGTKGLHIYENNVLGIQLTPNGGTDNGELKFDENGCLRLSNGAGGGGGQYLTISGQYADGTPVTEQYNGSEPVTIELGPGLCFGTTE